MLPERPVDGVEKGEPAPGAHHSCQFQQPLSGVREVREETGGEDCVDGPRTQRQPCDIRQQQGAARFSPRQEGGVQHLAGQVGADHRAPGSDRPAQGRQRTSGSAARVDHRTAGPQAELADCCRVGGSVVREAGVPARCPRGEEVLDVCVVVGHEDNDRAVPNRAERREAVHSFERCPIVRGHLSVICQHISKCAPGVHPSAG